MIAKLLITWYFFIFVSTEILSFFRALNGINVVLLEAIFLAGLFNYFRSEIRQFFSKINFISKSNLIILAILGLTFIQGFFSAPSTTDSMVYHLPKVMYWVQDQTVHQDVIRNIHDFKAPFAEYIVMHLYLLFGNDRFAFFSQWLAFGVCIYLSGIIAAQLGASKNQVNIIRLFSATLPIAVMQSASTQVDLVVTVLALIALHISLLLTKDLKISYGIWLGLAIGLGFFTKATFIIYLVVPLGLLLMSFFRSPKRKYLYIGLLVGIIALLIQLKFFSQNYSLYGNFLGKHILADGTELKYTNDGFSLTGITSNIIRNLMIHIPVPIFNKQGENGIVFLHQAMGFDINEERFTCCGTRFKVASVIYPQEDIVANSIHLLLIFIALFYLFKIKDFEKKYFYSLVVLSFIVFSAILKWQPYHSRLEIPIFILGIIGSVLIIGKKAQAILKVLLVLAIGLAFLVIVLNVSRPFVSYKLFFPLVAQFSNPYAVVPEAFYFKTRNQQYFNAEHFWYEPYKETVALLPKDQKVTISFDTMDDFEYPFWVLLKEKRIKFKVIPKVKLSGANYLIKTAPKIEGVDGFKLIDCKKTVLEYGYACLYNRKD